MPDLGGYPYVASWHATPDDVPAFADCEDPALRPVFRIDQAARDRIATDPAFLDRLAVEVAGLDDTPCADETCLHPRYEHDLDDAICWATTQVGDEWPNPVCPCSSFRDPQDAHRETAERISDLSRDGL